MPASFAKPAFAALLLLAMPLMALPAAAQDAQTIDRVNRLENDLRMLQRQVYRGGTPPSSGGSGAGAGPALTDSDGSGGSIANRLNARIDDLESQIRELTGRFEEVEFKSTQAQRRLDKLVEDVDFRLGQLERGGQPPAGLPPQGQPQGQGEQPPAGAQAGQGNPPQQLARGSTSATPGQAPSREGVLGSMPADSQGRPLPVTPGQQQSGQQQQQTARATPPAQSGPAGAAGKLPQGSPQERYNYAYRLLVQSDYANAEAAFREFIGAHPQDMLAGNAQYWLGETYYVRQQFEPAAQAFLNGYQHYPKSAKAPDSLLKLGMTLAAMKKTPEACAALGQLSKEFPNAPSHVKDAAVRERSKITCR